MAYVQAFISNNSFPTCLEELWEMASRYNMEELLGVMLTQEREGGWYGRTEWTAPGWCKRGDIVFFMHSRTAVQTISRLRAELYRQQAEMPEYKFWYLHSCLLRARSIWNTYGGKIFAIGRIAGTAKDYPGDEGALKHWKSNLYAPIEDMFALETPIDAAEFKAQLPVSRTGSITPVFGEDFTVLQKIILKKNRHVRDYFTEALPQPIPLTKVDSENWISVSTLFREDFTSILQLRRYCIDYLLSELGDQKTFLRDCPCLRGNRIVAYADSAILLEGKCLPVLATLSTHDNPRLFATLNALSMSRTILGKSGKPLEPDAIWNRVLVVIDANAIYLCSMDLHALRPVFPLHRIQGHDDVKTARAAILAAIEAVHSEAVSLPERQRLGNSDCSDAPEGDSRPCFIRQQPESEEPAPR